MWYLCKQDVICAHISEPSPDFPSPRSSRIFRRSFWKTKLSSRTQLTFQVSARTPRISQQKSPTSKLGSYRQNSCINARSNTLPSSQPGNPRVLCSRWGSTQTNHLQILKSQDTRTEAQCFVEFFLEEYKKTSPELQIGSSYVHYTVMRLQRKLVGKPKGLLKTKLMCVRIINKSLNYLITSTTSLLTCQLSLTDLGRRRKS